MYPDQDIADAEVIGFQVTASALRDRLDVMGVHASAVEAAFVDLVALELDSHSRLNASEGDLPADVMEERRNEGETWSRLDWSRWVALLRARLSGGDRVERWGRREAQGTASWLLSIWDSFDARYLLRAVLEAVDDDETITVDLADLIDGGWLDPTMDPRAIGASAASYVAAGALAPIVLTEGTFDAAVILSALKIRRPHLVDFIRLPDFHQRPEGGAAALRQTVRAFVAAGIPNRVVALFDNDSAARDVLRSFTPGELPSNIVIETLPSLPLATAYPTWGPEGERTMDINGRAVSIELFLGLDVLDRGAGLSAVRWGGVAEGLKEYQGAITDKAAIQQEFRRKCNAAMNNPRVIAQQDWTGIDLLLDAVMDALRRTA